MKLILVTIIYFLLLIVTYNESDNEEHLKQIE